MTSPDEAVAVHDDDAQRTGTTLADLRFPSLAAAMERYVHATDHSRAGPVERWSFAIALLGASAGMLLGTLLDGKAGSTGRWAVLRWS